MCRFAFCVAVSMLLSLALVGPAAVAAQDATPTGAGSLLGTMGYPELRVRVVGAAYDMPVTTVSAGRTLIALENAGDESWHGFLLRLPEGMTIDALMAATPGPGDAPPPWLFEASYPGFPGETQPGQTNYAVADLAPGQYLIVGDSFQPFVVTAGGATPAAAPEPTADATVRLFEYGFDLPAALAPGRHVWAVTNTGREPHELLLARSPAPITREQVLELVAVESQDATPTGGGPSGREILGVGGMGWLSPGATAWTEVALEPGTYVVLCYVFDPETGMPHAAMGMVDVFTVGGDVGTPTAEIPATPVGNQLAWVLAQLSGGAASLTEAELVAHLAPRFRAELPAPVVLDLLRQTTAGFALITVTGFAYPPTPIGAIALITAGTGEQGALVLTVEAEPPHRLTRLELSEPPAWAPRLTGAKGAPTIRGRNPSMEMGGGLGRPRWAGGGIPGGRHGYGERRRAAVAPVDPGAVAGDRARFRDDPVGAGRSGAAAVGTAGGTESGSGRGTAA